MSDDQEVRERVGRASPLVLADLEKLTQLNGVKHSELPQAIQRYFARQPLQVISLTDKSDKGVRFDLFERLNSGAISLTPQEVRAAVYGGEFLSFIEALAENADLQQLLKLQESNQHDGTAAEQVLKFFAYKNAQDVFRGGVTSFLNEFVEKGVEGFDFEAERQVFDLSMRFLAEAVGGPFVRRNTPVTPLVQFEACSVAVGRLVDAGEEPVVPANDWLNDQELVSASTGGTNTRSMLARRIERARVLFSPASGTGARGDG